MHYAYLSIGALAVAGLGGVRCCGRSVVCLGVHHKGLVAIKPHYDKLVVDPEDERLPEVSVAVLKRAFERLNLAEREAVLRERLVPVAWLPHITLYADGNDGAQPLAVIPQKKVVARIAPRTFAAIVLSSWGHDLTKRACNELKLSQPTFSSSQRVSSGQQLWVMGLMLAVVLLWPLLSIATVLDVASFILTSLFACMIWLRLLAISERAEPYMAKPEMNDDALPVYSILVPLFRETRVLPQLISALQKLNYPANKLDIKLILEQTDTVMRRKVASLSLPTTMEVIVVPASHPQTKPKALNYALPFARGQLVTIYDAEDIPEPMQLRMAAAAFAKLPHQIACLQAELTFYNPNENWLTRQFTMEYAVLFKLVLPALAINHLPLPLGGTSNHFRIDVLRQLGGWDPYNVTEDADIGIRLARYGFYARSLASCTYEEANTELRNWLQQRARWMKGFLQSWLVHMRNPVLLLRQIGFTGFLVVQAMLIGVVLSATLYPVFLGLTALFLWNTYLNLTEPSLIKVLFEGSYLGFFFIGWGIMILSGAMALRRKGYFGWWGTLLTLPIYCMLTSIAGWMALWQFIHAPFQWNKTRHGLSRFQAKVVK